MYISKPLDFHNILTLIEENAFSKAASNDILKLKPTHQLEAALFMLKNADALKTIIENYGKLPFNKHFDIDILLVNLDKKIYLKIEEFIDLRRFIKMTIEFENYFKIIDRKYLDVLTWFQDYKHLNTPLNLINEIIQMDGTIFDHASKELKEIRQNIKSKQRQLDKLLSQVLMRYQSYLNESMIVMRNDRYVIPIKESFKHKIKGVIHDVSASKQTVYIEPEDIRQVTQDIEYLNKLESKEIIQICTELSKKLKPFLVSLKSEMTTFVALDVLNAKTIYSMDIGGTLPHINKNGRVELYQARHPLIDKKDVVPIDIKIDETLKVLMITGPNTGGKTVALKTVGLFTLMMQTGILPPVDRKSHMAVFDQVFADIGDEQSIQQSLSTFSSHLTKIKDMFDHLEGHALILLDELGSGTDPVEGVSLAIAIIDELKKQPNNRIILTTHYSELKMYAYSQDDILTASVAFDERSLKPLYKIHLGIAGSSHALNIASRLGLPDEIIHKARMNLSGRQTNLAKQIEKINQEQNILKQEKEVIEQKSKLLEETIHQYQHKMSGFDKQKDDMLEKIKQKATKEYEKLKDEALKMIDNLSKVDKLTTPESAKLKGLLNQKIKKDAHTDLEPLKVGDHVLIPSYGQEGVITKVNKADYDVSVGLFELPFKREALTKHIPKPKSKEKPVTKYTGSAPSKAPDFELDLRGVRFEEVKVLMDKAIDDAFLSNTPYIRIIHGFGTGAVRKAVYDYIKQSKYIKSHRYGGEGEGLNGVTIITL